MGSQRSRSSGSRPPSGRAEGRPVWRVKPRRVRRRNPPTHSSSANISNPPTQVRRRSWRVPARVGASRSSPCVPRRSVLHPRNFVPRFPLCVLGLSPSELERDLSHVAPPQCWDRVSEMGRRPFDAQASPASQVLFEVFAPLERLVGLLRIRGGALGLLDGSPNNSGGVDTSEVTVTKAMSSGLQAAEWRT